MVEPRKVKSLTGQARWQGQTGATFATREEALADFSVEIEPAPVAPDQPPPSSVVVVGGGLVCFGIAALGCWLLYSLFTDQIEYKGFWRSSASILGCIWMTGGFFAGISAFKSAYELKLEGWSDRAYDAWSIYVYTLIKAAAVVIGFVLAYMLISWIFDSIFEGVSKGTIIIAVLLFAILLSLNSRKA